VPRTALTAIGIGDKVVFSGGGDSNGFYTTVDIYDVSTGNWSALQLSKARGFLSSAAADSTILVAGGTDGNNALNSVDRFSLTH
jgi:hypothetical protein